MSAERPRARFVPTLTEVVLPVDGSSLGTPIFDAMDAPELVPTSLVQSAVPEVAPSRSSVLESAVEGLLPQAREQLRQRLHAAAYALAEEQLLTMEDSLRQQLRLALREAAGMGARG